MNISALASSEEFSTNATGDYSLDLSQVWGAIHMNELLRKLCNKTYPETEEANNQAYKQWRSDYLPFIQRIERYYELLIITISEGDATKQMKLRAKSYNDMEVATETMKDTYLKLCPIFPVFLKLPRMNLESYYKEQMKVINSYTKASKSKHTDSINAASI